MKVRKLAKTSEKCYNYTSTNRKEATAATLEASCGHDTRKVLLMHSDNTLNAPSAQDETRLIPLSQGKFAIVDATDYEWLNQWKWYAHRRRRAFYAARSARGADGKRVAIGMHQLICGSGADHKDRDGLNNTRNNLRASTMRQNLCNRQGHTNSSSVYKGVSFFRRNGQWRAQILSNGKYKHIGLFSSQEEAARAYDKYAEELHGEFACLNFPQVAENINDKSI